MRKGAFTRWYSVLFGALLFLYAPVVLGQEFEVLFYEGFENGGSAPLGWTQEYVNGSRAWRFENGGYAPPSAPTFRHPSAAYAGQYNALFQDQSIGPIRKLVTPAINLIPYGTSTIKPTLTFWHAQDAWAGATDELKVYYRRSTTSSWVLLDHYTLTEKDWTYKEIILPDDAKTTTCQIAFEGKSNWGWGVCVDEVKVEERGFIDRTVESFELVKRDVTIPSGSKVNVFGNLLVIVAGNINEIPVNSVKINYTGTDIGDIAKVSLYHTRDSVFSVQNKLADNATIVGNEITLTSNFNLRTGSNYLWFTFDISNEAEHGNLIDFSISANSANLGGKWFPQTAISTTGHGTIWEALVYTDFSTDIGWTKTGLWEIGEPQGGGTNDPDYSFSGNSVLATNLDGNYPPAIEGDSPETAIAPQLNAKYYQNLSLRFRRWLNIDYFDKASIKLSVNEGDSWVNLYQNSTTVLDRYWRPININLSRWATRQENLQIMFSMDTTNYSTEYGGWNVDNYAVIGEFIHSDVGVTQMVSPTQACGMGNMTVSVMVKNFGGATVSTPFEVGYSLDGGETYVKETFTGSIASEQEMAFTFTTPVDLSNPGLKNFTLKTFLATDQDETNNTYTASLYSFPVLGFPYQTSFELSNSHWFPGGTNSSWQWGVPAGTKINVAADGTKVWATGLAKNHNNNELSYIESPCFDFTAAQMPVLSFRYMMHIEEGDDGLAIQYSVDGGNTWLLLPKHSNYALNWYDTENVVALSGPGWSKSTAAYVEVRNLLPNAVIGKPSVKFRFVFASDGTTTFEGTAIDQFKLYELPYDIGVEELNSPVSACEIGYDTPFGLRIKNYGYRTVPAGTQVPLHLKLNEQNIKTETYTLTTSIPMDGHEDMTTTNVFNLFNHGVYDIVAFTKLEVDDSRLNDTLTTQVEVYGIPGYTLGPDIGTNNPDTVILNAGVGYVSYAWYKFNDPNWEVIAGETGHLYQLPVNGWGEYRVDVANALGCTGSATILVAESDKDVGVTAIANVVSACSHPTPIKPTITINSFNSATFDGVETIPLVVEINDVVVLSEELTPENGWGGAANTTRSFTFAGSIDLSDVSEYRVAIYTNMSKDLNKLNDTLVQTIYTWGQPSVDMYVKRGNTFVEFDESAIVSTQADTIQLKVTEGYSTYVWERQALGSSQWDVVGSAALLKLSAVPNALPSATYRVTVMDENNCGQDVKTVFVNASDLTISQILRPSNDTLCYSSAKERLSIRVKNVGHDTFAAGTAIMGTAYGPMNTQQAVVTTVSPLGPNQYVDMEFPNNESYSVGEHFYNFVIECVNDPNDSNNSKSHMLVVNPSPTAIINPSVVYRIFGEFDDYTVSPVYTGNIVSYLWDDDEYYPTEDPELLIWGPPMQSVYTVTVENDHGCSASASIQFITSDLELSAITSPKNNCELHDDTPVTFTLYNNGNTTYPLGTQLNVNVFLNGTLLFSEIATLSKVLLPQTSISITLGQKVNLGGMSTATIRVDVNSATTEVYQNNNSLNKNVNALGYPTVTLGEDRDVHAWQEILDPGYFNAYSWHDNSTQRTFTATQSGTYSVTVTDFSGCQGYAEVTLTFYVHDIEITDIIAPVSACELSDSEPVTLKFKNSGNYVFPTGSVLNLGYELNGVDYDEDLVLSSPFGLNQEMTVTLNETIDLSQPGMHNVELWVDVQNDMIPENNRIIYPVDSYPPVNFSFGMADTVYTYIPITLDAGSQYVAFLWQDGSTGQTYTATQTGLYYVTVADANGCEGYDEVYIIFNKSDINVVSVVTPAEEQCRVPNMPIEIVLKNERNHALGQGAVLTVNCTVDYATPLEITETFTLSNIFNVDDEVVYLFDQKLNLAPNTSYTLDFRVDYAGVEGNEYEHITNVHPTPSVNLGPDTAYVEFPYTLVAGVGGVTYLWSTGSTASSIEVLEPGKYWIEVTNEWGCSASDTIVLLNANWVHPIFGGGVLKVYPNPVDDVLTLSMTDMGDKVFTVELISPVGQVVYNTTIYTYENSIDQINVNGLSPGVYLLRIASQKDWATLRIVVNR